MTSVESLADHDAHHTPSHPDERVLADLTPGTRAVVVRVVSPHAPAMARRLEDLGFTPGTPVEVLRRAPLHDPVIYRIKDYDICLRRAQAACIHTVAADQ